MSDIIPTALFYMFAAVLVLSALMVILARNPVHSVLFLILAFFNAAGLFLLLGAEFVAFILIIVYVGAVAVLFLFVVMMLDIDFAEMRKGAWKVWPVGLLVGVVLVAQLVITAASWQSLPSARDGILTPYTKITKSSDGNIRSLDYGPKGVAIEAYIYGPEGQKKPDVLYDLARQEPDNTHAIGNVLYTAFIYPFQVAGLILLVAMIGAITLTLRLRGDVRRQDITRQMTRRPEEAMVIKKVEKGQGIS